MMNDLRLPQVQTWKYVDDTTVAEIVPRNALGDAQTAVKVVEDWSKAQKMQLNADKCKVMVIDYKRQKHHFTPLLVDGKVLETVESARILGVTISCNLKWNNHVNDVIKRANKRLYFFVLLKRARVPADDIINFYCTTIRPVLEYCAQIFHHALPAYLSDDIERVQRRALSIISPELSYHDSSDRHGLASLYDRRMKLCTDLFLSVSNPSHKLYNLLPDRHFSAYNTRHRRVFNMPRFRTDRFQFSFIPAMCACANLDF